MPKITETRILIMSDNGFEQSELETPLDQLRALGAEVDVATPDGADIKGWQDKDWGNSVSADLSIADVDVSDYDALVLPGGQMNPDLLRVNPAAVDIIRSFASAGKPVAAICHAPWLLVEAGLASGLNATSYNSIKTDMINAGANWVDQSVVVDGQFITSRDPGDLDQFVKAIAEMVTQEVAVV